MPHVSAAVICRLSRVIRRSPLCSAFGYLVILGSDLEQSLSLSAGNAEAFRFGPGFLGAVAPKIRVSYLIVHCCHPRPNRQLMIMNGKGCGDIRTVPGSDYLRSIATRRPAVLPKDRQVSEAEANRVSRERADAMRSRRISAASSYHFRRSAPGAFIVPARLPELRDADGLLACKRDSVKES